jgi:hypothetical protein
MRQGRKKVEIQYRKRGGWNYQYIAASGYMTGGRAAMGGWSLLAVWWGLARMLGRSARLCTCAVS